MGELDHPNVVPVDRLTKQGHRRLEVAQLPEGRGEDPQTREFGRPSAVFEPERQLLVVNTHMPMWVQLARRTRADQGNQQGTPYTMSRAPLVAPSGLPCNQPPWGLLTAVDLGTGAVAWEVSLGRMRGLDQVAEADRWGSINFGGPIVTAGGLVFIAAATDEKLRGYDIETGRELWQAALPGGGQATPMTYTAGGRQYLLIAAGGHSSLGTTLGDHVVAYALPH